MATTKWEDSPVHQLSWILGEQIKEVLSCREPVPIYFGTVLGAGVSTMAIEIDYPFVRDGVPEGDMVMIITNDDGKMEFLQELLGKDSIVAIDTMAAVKEALEGFLEYYEYSSLEEAEEDGNEFILWEEMGEFSLIPLIQQIEDEGFNVFFMPRLEEHTPETAGDFCDVDVAAKALEAYFSQMDFILEEFDSEATSEAALEKIEDEVPESLISKAKEVIRGWLESVSALSRVAGNVWATMDIHPGQFLRHEGRIICIDPVMP